MGFLADIKAEQIKSCLENNYYSGVFSAESCLKAWLRDPKPDYTRHIVFTSSTAAFVGLPGYITYTPAKVAVRALADTLRQELLLYGSPDVYQVHCSFPGTFISEGFIEEQSLKPDLTKKLESSNAPIDELIKREMSSFDVARKLIAGLERGDYFVTFDFQGDLLLNNMRGPSPRNRPIYDLTAGLIATVAWFFVRRNFDKEISQHRRSSRPGP
jgi:3-dehydrosphinganine reductase